MVDLLEYNEARWPTRALQQEEEEYAEKHADRLLQGHEFQWSLPQGKTAPASPELLVVSCNPGNCALLQSCLQALQPLASILLPTLPTHPSSEEEAVQQGAAAMTASASADGSLVLCCCKATVPAEQCRGLAVALLEQLKPQRVLVVASVQGEPLQAIQGTGDPSQEFMAFLLTTATGGGSSSSSTGPPIPYLPTGCVIGGLPAGLLTQCQLRGLPGSLVASLDSVPHLIPETLPQLAAAVAKVLAAQGLTSVGAQQLLRGLQDQELLHAAKHQCERHVPAPSLYA